jgi:hypothetical protein
MNIRLDSKEMRFRMSQDEVKDFLESGWLREEIRLPSCQIHFQVEFGGQTQVATQVVIQVENEVHSIIFRLAPTVRDRLKTAAEFKDPIVTVYEEIQGQRLCFKLEIDAFSSKQRGKIK